MIELILSGYLIRRTKTVVFSLKSRVGEHLDMISSIESKNIIWINPSRPFATEFATLSYFQATVWSPQEVSAKPILAGEFLLSFRHYSTSASPS